MTYYSLPPFSCRQLYAMPKIEHGPECWMVGKKVAVLYDDGKWYPADIISHQPGKKEPFTLRFETGETVDTELPDKDIL